MTVSNLPGPADEIVCPNCSTLMTGTRVYIGVTQPLKDKLRLYEQALREVYRKEVSSMYQRCPDCWHDECSENKVCIDYTGKGYLTPIQKLIKEVLPDVEKESHVSIDT